MSEKEPTFEVTDRRRTRKSTAAGSDRGKANTAEAPQDVKSPEPDRSTKSPPSAAGQDEASVEEREGQAEAAAGSMDTGSGGAASAGEMPPESEAGPQDEGGNFQMPEITTLGLVQFTLATLAQQAWYDLGLQVNPAIGKAQANLAEARLAIDSVAALLPVVAPRLDDTARRDMQNLVATLRLNYVEQTRRQS